MFCSTGDHIPTSKLEHNIDKNLSQSVLFFIFTFRSLAWWITRSGPHSLLSCRGLISQRSPTTFNTIIFLRPESDTLTEGTFAAIGWIFGALATFFFFFGGLPPFCARFPALFAAGSSCSSSSPNSTGCSSLAPDVLTCITTTQQRKHQMLMALNIIQALLVIIS